MATQYQLWIEDDSYSKEAILKKYKRLHYRQMLNDVGFAEIEMHPDDAKIDDIALMKRLKIIRDGTIVFGGIVLRLDWKVPRTAPASEAYTFYSPDHAVYAKWRICLPLAGETHEQEGPDDSADVLKDFVHNNMGAGAVAARRFSDLTIAADNNDGDSITAQARYAILFNLLQKLAAIHDLDWRFEAGASGCTFKVASEWGYDRTMGNGVNEECVFAVDRHNMRGMSYVKDGLAHYNYVYVGGQGEGALRSIVERSDAGDIASYKRRERFVDARQLSLTASLQNRGDAALNEMEVIEAMNVEPIVATWKAASGTTWDLGDKVTIYVRDWPGHSLSYDGKVVGIDVTVTPDQLEVVTPILEAV